MMEYNEDREASAGLLRLAVQRMSQHAAALTPICYTVWYEYLAGVNPRLEQRMELLLKENPMLGDAEIQDLFKRYCSEFSIEMQKNIRDDAQRILGNIKQFAEDARHSTSEFGGHLKQSANVLSNQNDSASLQKVIAQLHGETTSMVTTMHGLSENLASSQHEINALRQQLENARAEAMVDPLTGVMNRRGFNLRMDESLEDSRREQRPLSLVLVDIDFFKKINDSYGHLFGDKVIRGLAEVLKANIKGKDTVARLGGEEFGLLLPETDLSGAKVLSEKIRRTMELSKIRRLDKNEQIGGITISLGVAMLSDQEDPMKFFDRADKALYASKGNGRNQVTAVG